STPCGVPLVCGGGCPAIPVVFTTDIFPKPPFSASNSKAPVTIDELLPKLKLPVTLTVTMHPGISQWNLTPGRMLKLPFPAMYTSRVRFTSFTILQVVSRVPTPPRSSTHDTDGGCGGGGGGAGGE
ncbi:hypothetical protein V8G54_009018, partial [Vigna mungo]